jgi:putative ABC transport system permease protein
MTVPFTLLTLKHQKWRTLLAVLGVAFASLLVFVQLGFLGMAESTAVTLYNKLDYELAILSPEYLDVNRPRSFPRARLFQLLADPDVEHVAPIYITANLWRIVEPSDKKMHGRRRAMLMLGFNVNDKPLLLPELPAKIELLRETGAVLIDSRSRPYFGEVSEGVETELGAARVRVVGDFALGTGFGADGMVLMSDQTYAQINGVPLDRVGIGLVKLRPGADREQVAARLRLVLSSTGREAVRVSTRRVVEKNEKGFWVYETSLGLIFNAGVVVALLVGVVFVYQVISSDLKNRVREFATLKAIGYSDRYLDRTVSGAGLGLWPARLSARPGCRPAPLQRDRDVCAPADKYAATTSRFRYGPGPRHVCNLRPFGLASCENHGPCRVVLT